MGIQDLNRCRRILEVPSEATPEEVTSAYHRLKRFHGKDAGLALAPTLEEFSPAARQEVLDEIEEAYAMLKAVYTEMPEPAPAPEPFRAPEPVRASEPTRAPESVPAPEVQAPAAEPEELPANASSLRKARGKAGLTLDQVAQETCVRKEYLRALEEETFEDLTRLAAVNIRGYLTAFANTVGVPTDLIVPIFMKRLTDWQGLKR